MLYMIIIYDDIFDWTRVVARPMTMAMSRAIAMARAMAMSYP